MKVPTLPSDRAQVGSLQASADVTTEQRGTVFLLENNFLYIFSLPCKLVMVSTDSLFNRISLGADRQPCVFGGNGFIIGTHHYRNGLTCVLGFGYLSEKLFLTSKPPFLPAPHLPLLSSEQPSGWCW